MSGESVNDGDKMKLFTLYESEDQSADRELIKLAGRQKFLWDELKTQTSNLDQDAEGYNKTISPPSNHPWPEEYPDIKPTYQGISDFAKWHNSNPNMELDKSTPSRRLRKEYDYIIRDIGKLLDQASNGTAYDYKRWCEKHNMQPATQKPTIDEPLSPPRPQSDSKDWQKGDIKLRRFPGKQRHHAGLARGENQLQKSENDPKPIQNWKQYTRGGRQPSFEAFEQSYNIVAEELKNQPHKLCEGCGKKSVDAKRSKYGPTLCKGCERKFDRGEVRPR